MFPGGACRRPDVFQIPTFARLFPSSIGVASSSARCRKKGGKERCTRLRELGESAEDGGQVFLESSGQSRHGRPKETARSVKSIYLHDTRRGVQDQGSCKMFFHVPHFVDHQ